MIVRFAHILVLAVACALGVLAAPSVVRGAEPPNENDPCSSAGRNTCGTLGVGFHKEYRYGIRWFGDFRGVVPGKDHTFCLDLRFWYASPAYRYRAERSAELRNADGEVVPVSRQQRIAYAVWNYGRSSNPNQQAAVALYVHSLMGDARSGEVDPAALNQAVVSLYEKVARNSARYHGPYRIELRISGGLAVGKQGQATIRVRSAAGDALPGVRLELTAQGAKELPEQVVTDTEGIATVPLTPTNAKEVRLSAKAGSLASTLPSVFRATTAAAAANAQRLAAPSSQQVSATASAPVKTQIRVSTRAMPAQVALGQASRDQVAISGTLPSWHATVTVQIYGPFPSAEAIRCDGTPAWQGSFRAAGSGVFTTPPATLAQVGWFTYQEDVPGDAQHNGLRTPCGVPSETFRVAAQPRVSTTISSQRVKAGAEIFDRVRVEGLVDQSATVQAALYGPFAMREEISCDTDPFWSGSLAVEGDGEYRTEPVALEAAGFYTYKEWIVTSGFVRATETGCGEKAETTLARAKPTVTTVVSSQVVRPGTTIFDRIRVAGLAGASAEIRVELFGPFPSRTAMRCQGRPYWTGAVTAKGDGEIRSPSVKVAKAGFYTYRERLIGTAVIEGFTAACALVSETSLAAPRIATGRHDTTGRNSASRRVTASNTKSSAPARVRLASVGLDAPLSPVGIDVDAGVLDVPANISQAGWWKDGTAPGTTAGAILIAGHVDSADAGPGAFFALHRANAGERVQLTTANGRTLTYRVVSVRHHRRSTLPLSVYSRDGAPRLVLVTCGGPFDPVTGHYRDNVVLTAVPTN